MITSAPFLLTSDVDAEILLTDPRWILHAHQAKRDHEKLTRPRVRKKYSSVSFWKFRCSMRSLTKGKWLTQIPAKSVKNEEQTRNKGPWSRLQNLVINQNKTQLDAGSLFRLTETTFTADLALHLKGDVKLTKRGRQIQSPQPAWQIWGQVEKLNGCDNDIHFGNEFSHLKAWLSNARSWIIYLRRKIRELVHRIDDTKDTNYHFGLQNYETFYPWHPLRFKGCLSFRFI